MVALAMKWLNEMISHSFDLHERYYGMIEQLRNVLYRRKTLKLRALDKYNKTFFLNIAII
jgi:hypothetical protein